MSAEDSSVSVCKCVVSSDTSPSSSIPCSQSCAIFLKRSRLSAHPDDDQAELFNVFHVNDVSKLFISYCRNYLIVSHLSSWIVLNNCCGWTVFSLIQAMVLMWFYPNYHPNNILLRGIESG